MPNDAKKAQVGWLKGGGVTLDDEVFLLELKLGAAAEFLGGLLGRKVAARLAIQRKIELSDDELADAVAAFYADRDLFEEEQISTWLKATGVTDEAVRERIREMALAERAKAELLTEQAVTDRFSSERYDYALANVEVFGFANAGEAKEFVLAVREKETEPGAGEQRQMTRRDAPEEIAATLFSCEPGDLVGPLENDDGEHEVFRLTSRSEAELDDDLRARIRDQMFRQLIEAELIRDPMKFLK